MTSEQIQQARNLLRMMVQNDTKIVLQSYANGTRTDFEYVSSTVIEWLTANGLLIISDALPYDEFFSLEVYKPTELGSLVESFAILEQEWDMAVVDGNALEKFLITGKYIQNILQKYNDGEIDPLRKLVTEQELSAYSEYYRQSIQQILTDRTRTCELHNPNMETVTLGLNEMFTMSVSIGEQGINETRTNDYVFKKCMEELGEMAVEDQIANDLSYKLPGVDGVKGEAVDLAICAMDMFALQCPGMSAKEIENEFVQYMHKKINKWKETIGI